MWTLHKYCLSLPWSLSRWKCRIFMLWSWKFCELDRILQKNTNFDDYELNDTPIKQPNESPHKLTGIRTIPTLDTSSTCKSGLAPVTRVQGNCVWIDPCQGSSLFLLTPPRNECRLQTLVFLYFTGHKSAQWMCDSQSAHMQMRDSQSAHRQE